MGDVVFKDVDQGGDAGFYAIECKRALVFKGYRDNECPILDTYDLKLASVLHRRLSVSGCLELQGLADD